MTHKHEHNFEVGPNMQEERNLATVIAVNALSKILIIPKKISTSVGELLSGLGDIN